MLASPIIASSRVVAWNKSVDKAQIKQCTVYEISVTKSAENHSALGYRGSMRCLQKAPMLSFFEDGGKRGPLLPAEVSRYMLEVPAL